jgi:hypothetical protein
MICRGTAVIRLEVQFTEEQHEKNFQPLEVVQNLREELSTGAPLCQWTYTGQNAREFLVLRIVATNRKFEMGM